MAEIESVADGKTVAADSEDTILEALLHADIPLSSVCGGQARCSTCRVIVLKGIQNCSQPTDAERALAKRLHFPVHVRLACQTRVTGDVSVRRLIIDGEDLDLVDRQFATDDSVGAEQQLAIALVTVRGATDFDEVNFPYDILYIMGRYFRSARRIITGNGGSIDSIMGGRLIATFRSGTGEDVERAVWTGLELLQSVRELNQSLEKLAYQPLKIAAGIHYGRAIMVPTADTGPQSVVPLGGAIGLASRVHDANQQLGTQLLVSESAFKAVAAKAYAGRSVAVERPDRKGTAMAYEIRSMVGPAPQKAMGQQSETLSFNQRLQALVQRLGLLGNSKERR